METPAINYQSKKGVHVPKDVKEYILKRIREEGKSAAEVAKEHGIGKTAIYAWLRDSSGSPSNDLARLQRENITLKQLVAELSLVVRENQKKQW